ncbi:DUF1697 domain-containing protein [Nitratireductor luteus]|uniref:DUF1697 domain-containing protein n=1 Tax=Nitratireductor luteus TaxID=2976980 RepID=UPI002240DF93|nr:DUF1697 domain-containing protein [Nitratireductor luteus]
MSEATRYIVLFRGVGGKTQLPVARLRAVLEADGFRGVKTYINSGNAVLASALGESALALRVAGLVRAQMGFDKSVLVRSLAEWDAMIAQNPFPEAVDEPTKLHVFTLEQEPEADRMEALREKATGTERFAVRGRTLYLHTPDGMGNSRFAPKIETTLKIAMTVRNWRTMLALRDLAAAIA